MNRYTVYGNLAERDTVILATTLAAKGLEFDLCEETSSLALPLASRTGDDVGPYLRTPEGFVLSGLHGMLDWVEGSAPGPALLPDTPVRHTIARLLEDWLELWLPRWPRRSWVTLEKIGHHLHETGYLLGRDPCRPDWILAAWLESDVLIHDHARQHLLQKAPRLISLGGDLLEATTLGRGNGNGYGAGSPDDVIPISLLSILEEVARDYHAYLELNRQACKEGADRVLLDLGLGRSPVPVNRVAEARRAEIGWRLSRVERSVRRDVRQVLEPVGAWHALTLPPVLGEIDPRDPRSL
jgi:hypothetical protein